MSLVYTPHVSAQQYNSITFSLMLCLLSNNDQSHTNIPTATFYLSNLFPELLHDRTNTQKQNFLGITELGLFCRPYVLPVIKPTLQNSMHFMVLCGYGCSVLDWVVRAVYVQVRHLIPAMASAQHQ